MKLPLLSTFALAAALLAAPVQADTIIGTVLAPDGSPMPGINIDAIRLSNGNNINLQNDGTNALGQFTTTIPADVYDLWFYPPAPPTTSHVTYVMRNVVVSGTKNLGTIQLQAGWIISGHVQTTSGATVSGLKVNCTDNVTGFNVPLAGNVTNAFGNFQVSVPRNSVELFFDGKSAQPAFTLVSRFITLTPTANTNIGNVVMEPGFTVSGTVVRTSNGLPVAGVDLDFKNTVSGVIPFVPNDTTTASGTFSVILGAGTYVIDFAAQNALRLAGRRITTTISANTALGSIALDNGALLSGVIKSFDNIVQVNADVDVYRQSTGELIPSFADNSSATGAYQVVVPLDNLEVVFRPPTYTVPLGSDVHTNFLVTADTTLNGFLPACPAPNNYGAGLAGTGGFVPHLAATGGTNRVGNPSFALQLTNGRGAATGVLVISAQQRSLPFLGGTLLVSTSPAFSVKIPIVLGGASGVGGVGSKNVPANLPSKVAGLDAYCQVALRDPNTSKGWSFSDGLHFKICP